MKWLFFVLGSVLFPDCFCAAPPNVYRECMNKALIQGPMSLDVAGKNVIMETIRNMSHYTPELGVTVELWLKGNLVPPEGIVCMNIIKLFAWIRTEVNKRNAAPARFMDYLQSVGIARGTLENQIRSRLVGGESLTTIDADLAAVQQRAAAAEKAGANLTQILPPVSVPHLLDQLEQARVAASRPEARIARLQIAKKRIEDELAELLGPEGALPARSSMQGCSCEDIYCD
ncbi:MAG: hypothetical protein LBB25_02190 [Holosporaceae bacterium]|nr:hypothetical protein [Holosporaceae bacterium]